MISWMKVTVILTVVVQIAYADFYDAKYDNFDIKPIIENDRILMSFIRCFLDQGPCTPDAKSFKSVIPEALESSCEKCSPKQRQLIKTVIRTVMERHSDSWEKLVEKFDKDKKYKNSFDKFINES